MAAFAIALYPLQPGPPPPLEAAGPAAALAAGDTVYAMVTFQVPGENADSAAARTEPRLRIGGRVQARYEFRRPEVGEDLSSFYLRRVRIDLRGTLIEGRVSYRVMPELTGVPGLRDAWVEYEVAPGLRLRAGQFAAPFQWLRAVSGNRHHFAERGIASEALFGLPGGYDIGVGAHGTNDGNTLAYGVGVFDGAGRNVRLSNSAGHLGSARVTRALVGTLPTEEPDLAHTPRPRVAFGAGVQGATASEIRPWDLGRSPGGDPRADWLAGTADLVLQWRGLSAVPTGYLRRVWPDDPAVEPYTGLARVLSAGYLVVPGVLEVVGRHTRAHLDRDDAATGKSEWSVGLNLYHEGHGWKTQADYTRHAGALLPSDHVFTVQMQLLF